LKRSGYKYQIEKELLNRDWEIVEVGSNEDWWDDEHWKVQLRFDPNLCFVLCFIVDPQYDQPRIKGQGIYEILASTKFPDSWNDRENSIGSISMTKRKFDTKLKEFMGNLDDFKKGKTATNN
jgi:hypothetical protein